MLVQSELERRGTTVIIERIDSPDAFSASVRAFAPDVVLSDHSKDGFDARAALHHLRQHYPMAPLILLARSFDDHFPADSIREGAEDIVLLSNLGRLGDAIESALVVRRRLRKLTPRQLEVLRLVAAGHTTREIARRLKLSAKTVESHRGEIMKRLGMHDVVGLVRYAVRVGLVGPES